jgi:6-phosphogluconate dehydrogenase (decarboxylating)
MPAYAEGLAVLKAGTSEQGYLHCGPVKMIHNGIEYDRGR